MQNPELEAVQQSPRGHKGDTVEVSEIPGWLLRALKLSFLGYIFIGLAVIAGFLAYNNVTNHQRANDLKFTTSQQAQEREVIQRVVSGDCTERNLNKDATRALINTAVGTGSQTIDFTKVPSFQFLDKATKQFFLDITKPTPGTSSTDRLLAFRDTLVNEDCDALAQKAKDELKKAQGG